MQLLIAQRKILKPKAKNKWHLLRSEEPTQRTSVRVSLLRMSGDLSSTQLQNRLAILDWVRKSDESRCQLASIRLGATHCYRQCILDPQPISTDSNAMFESVFLYNEKHEPRFVFSSFIYIAFGNRKVTLPSAF